MSHNNTILEDITKLTGNVAGIALESGKNIQDKVKSLVAGALDELDVVTRDEFEIVKKMAEQATLENEKLKKQIEELEKGQKPAKKASKK